MRIHAYYFMLLLSTVAMPAIAYADDSPISTLESRASNGDVDAQLSLAQHYMSGDGVDINLSIADNLLMDAQKSGKQPEVVAAAIRRLRALQHGVALSNSIAGVQNDVPTYKDMDEVLQDTTFEPVSLTIGWNKNPSALRSDRDGLLSLYPKLLVDTGFNLPKRDKPAADGSTMFSGVITNIRNPRRADLLCHLLKLAECDEQRTPILDRPKNMPVQGTMNIPRMDVRAQALPPPVSQVALPQLVARVDHVAPGAFDDGNAPISQVEADTRVKDMSQRLVDVEARVQTAQALAESEAHARALAEEALHAEQAAQAPRVQALRAAEDRLKQLESLSSSHPGDLASAKALVAKAQRDLDESNKRLQAVQDEKDHAQLHELALQGELRVAHAATDVMQSRLLEAQKVAKGFQDQVSVERTQRKLQETHSADEKRALQSMIDGLKKDRDAAKGDAAQALEQVHALQKDLAQGEDRSVMETRLVQQERSARQAAEREIDAELDAREEAEHQAALARAAKDSAEHAAALSSEQAEIAKNDANIAQRQVEAQKAVVQALRERDVAHAAEKKDLTALDQIRSDMDTRERLVVQADKVATNAALQLGVHDHNDVLIQRVRAATERVLTLQHQIDEAHGHASHALLLAMDDARNTQIAVLAEVAAASSQSKAHQMEIAHSVAQLKDAHDRVKAAQHALLDAQTRLDNSKKQSDAAEASLTKVQSELLQTKKDVDNEHSKRVSLEKDLTAARAAMEKSQKDMNAANLARQAALKSVGDAKQARELLEKETTSLSARVHIMEDDARRNKGMLDAAQRLASVQANALKDEDAHAREMEKEALSAHQQLVKDNVAAAAALKDAVEKAKGEGKAELVRIQHESDERMKHLEEELKASQSRIEDMQRQRAADIAVAQQHAAADALVRVKAAELRARQVVDMHTNTVIGRQVYTPPTTSSGSTIDVPKLIPAQDGGAGAVSTAPLPVLHAPDVALPKVPPVVAAPPAVSLPPVLTPAVVPAPVVHSTIVSTPSASVDHERVAKVVTKAVSTPLPYKDPLLSSTLDKKVGDNGSFLRGIWKRLSVIWGGDDGDTPPPVVSPKITPVVANGSVGNVSKKDVAVSPAHSVTTPPVASLAVHPSPPVSSHISSSIVSPASISMAPPVSTPPVSTPAVVSPVTSVSHIPASPAISAAASPAVTAAVSSILAPGVSTDHVHIPLTLPTNEPVGGGNHVLPVSPVPAPTKEMNVHATPSATPSHVSPAHDTHKAAAPVHNAHRVRHAPTPPPVAEAGDDNRMTSMDNTPAPVASPVPPASDDDNTLVPVAMHLPPGVSMNTGDSNSLMAIPQRRHPAVAVSQTDDNLTPEATDGVSEMVLFSTLPNEKAGEIEIQRLKLSLPSNLASAHFYLHRSSHGYTVVATGFGDYGAAASYCRAVRGQGESCTLTGD